MGVLMKLLLVEDSKRLQRFIKEGLENEGFAVDVAGDGQEGLALVEVYEYDVVILDLMMPGMGGLTMLSELRAMGNAVHVLIPSAKDQVSDRILGLEKGGDDYLIKPFVFQELVARIKALLRREFKKKDPWVSIGSIRVNTNTKEVFRRDSPVELTPKEFSLLEYLLMQRGTVISRCNLTEHLYAGFGDIASNVIDVLICTLRKKIKVAGEPSMIQTKRGSGYIIR